MTSPRDELSTDLQGSDPALSRWREQILHVTLVATAVLAGIAYVPGVLAAIGRELWLVVAVDTLAWALVIGLIVFRRWVPYAARALTFVGAWFLLALILLLEVGPLGGGAIWLAAFPVLTSVFFSLRGTFVSLALTTLASLGVAGRIHYEQQLQQTDPAVVVGYDLASWAGTAGGLLFIAGILSLAIGYLIRGLERSLAEATRSRHEVAEVNRELARQIEERERLQAQLLQSQKMEALGTLAGGIAHDFNNLLVPILMESQEVRDRLAPDGADRESLDGVVRSALRARDLVQRILTFSRGSEATRHPLEVEPVVREVGNLIRSIIPASIEVELDLDADGTWVMAGETELHQMIMNLASNAFLAMKPIPGDQAEGPGPETGDRLTFGTRRDSSRRDVLIWVQDTGRGMPTEVQERAFDPFFTTRGPGEGTGLGLATVHGIAKQLGGKVEIESEVGRGTRVEIRLPTADPVAGRDALPETSKDESDDQDESDTTSVLVVDDEPLVRRSTRKILTRMGYLVTETATPESALRRIQEAPLAFDVVVTDQSMPGMTGIELARRLRRLRPDLPIILLSGYLDDAALEQVQGLQLDGVLQKPYDRNDLGRLIRQATREG